MPQNLGVTINRDFSKSPYVQSPPNSGNSDFRISGISEFRIFFSLEHISRLLRIRLFPSLRRMLAIGPDKLRPRGRPVTYDDDRYAMRLMILCVILTMTLTLTDYDSDSLTTPPITI